MFDPASYLASMQGIDPQQAMLENIRKQQAMGMLNQGGQPTPLPAPEAESTLSRVAGYGLGALHYIGGTIDKTFGGRAIRAGIKGALGGDVAGSEFASMIPFTDALGVSDESNRVSGEDILKQAGALQGEGTKGTFELRDLAGPALELALDPSTYLTLGTSKALTGAGQAASKAGILPGKATARMAGFAAGTPEAAALATKMAVPESEIAGKALSGLAGIGLPFSKPSAIVGTGDSARALAGWLEKKADGMMYGKVGTALSRLFDTRVHGADSAAGQRVAREVLDPALQKGTASAYQTFNDAGKLVEDAGLLDHAQGPRLSRLIEGVPDAGGAATPAEQAAVDFIKSRYGTAQAEGRAVGRDIPTLTDPYADYAHRQRTPIGRDTPGYSGGTRLRPLDASAPAETSREKILRGFTGGTQGINDMVKDQNLRAMLDNGQELLAQGHIAENYLGHGPAQQARMFQLNNAPIRTAAESAELAGLEATSKQAAKLVNWVGDLDPLYAAEGHSFFGNHPLTDLATGMLHHEQAQAGANAVHSLLAGSAVHSSRGVGKDMVPAIDALKAVGLDMNTIVPGGTNRGGRATLAQKMLDAGTMDYLPVGGGPPDMASMFIPKSAVDDAMRYSQVASTPEALNPIMKAYDSLTNLTKAGQTSLFPSFHSRNMVTGIWQNAVIGARDPRYSKLNPMGYIQPFLDAAALRNNGVVSGAAEIFKDSHPGITDAQATRLLHEEMFVNSTRHGPSTGAASEAIGKGTLERSIPMQLPGTGGEKTIAETLSPAALSRQLATDPRTAGSSQWYPMNVRGVGLDKPRDATAFLPVKFGQEVGALGDDLNRMSAHVALRRQGVVAAEASMRSRGAHYDYSRLTDFERNFMRRVLPFYGWTRNNLPFQLEELATRPGGLAGSAVKGVDSLRQSEGFVPDSVSEGLAIPVGQEENGQSRFLTHFGLPVEDAFSMLGTGPSPITRTGEKLLGMANPIIKMPAEMIAGKQMYSGRQLDDLYSTTGNPTAEQILMNSPLSRLMTTGRQLTDDRKSVLDKALNLLGPGKITDVDTDKARQVAGRDAVEGLLKSQGAARTFDTLYVPPDQLGNLSPEQMQLYRLYKYLEAQRLAQNKARGAANKESKP